MGDVVVVINAKKVELTSNKWRTKLYRWHTGYPGGLKQRRAEEMLDKNPTQILRKAVLGMLNRNKLRHQYMEKRLKIFAGPNHPHIAQLPSDVQPLPKVPKGRKGDFHFGLNRTYADPSSYQPGIPK